MATSIYDSSFFPKSYLTYLTQRRIGTGMSVRSEDIGAIAEAEINARYADASKRRALGIQEKSVNDQYDLGMAKLGAERDIYDMMAGQQKQAGLVGAGVNTLTSIPTGYMLGKELGWWGTKTPAPTKESVAAINSTEAYQPPPISGIGAGGEAGVATEALNYIPSGGLEAGGEAFNYVPGVEGAGGETAAGSSIYSSYAPFIAGGLRSATGLISGEEPLSAVAHGAGVFGGAAAGGALGGAIAGSAFPVIGNVIGGIMGAIGGDAAVSWIEDACIIVTACNGRGSEEVQITREFRDRYLDADSLRGYYAIATPVVSIMHKHPAIKKFIKKHLVDHLISYGRWALSKTTKKPSVADRIITRSFLSLIKTVGMAIPSYTRANGEVY